MYVFSVLKAVELFLIYMHAAIPSGEESTAKMSILSDERKVSQFLFLIQQCLYSLPHDPRPKLDPVHHTYLTPRALTRTLP